MDIDPRQYENIVSFDFCFGFFFFFSTIDRDELGSVWLCSIFFFCSLYFFFIQSCRQTF